MDVTELNTTAVPVLGAARSIADRRRWVLARQGGVCSSDLPGVLRLSAHDSPFSVYRSKMPGGVDEWRDAEKYEAARTGVREMRAMRIAAELTEWRVIHPPAVLWRHPVHEFAMCSPDRLAVHRDTGEVRPIVLGAGMHGVRMSLPEARIRLGWQTAIFGGDHLGFLYRPNDVAFMSFDPADLTKWIIRAEYFWEKVLAQDPPTMDGHPATTRALYRAYPTVDPDASPLLAGHLSRALRDAEADARRAAETLATVRNVVLGALGTRGALADDDGTVTARRVVMERSGHVVPASTQIQLRLTRRGTDTEGTA